MYVALQVEILSELDHAMETGHAIRICGLLRKDQSVIAHAMDMVHAILTKNQSEMTPASLLEPLNIGVHVK